jgi:hypothetical protein
MMSETTETPIPQAEPSSDKYKTLIVVLTVFTTVLAAVLAALQADASIREDIANRDSQFLAIQASGELHRAGLEANYEFTVFGDYLKNLQESTILQLTALEQEQNGNDDAAKATNELASIAQARADTAVKFSTLYSDARYAPQGDELMPLAEQYIIDLNARSNEIVAQQNESADAYNRWNRKADSYVTALTILAVAFFLFGLAQAVKNARMRFAFAVFGIVVILFTLFISAITVIA